MNTSITTFPIPEDLRTAVLRAAVDELESAGEQLADFSADPDPRAPVRAEAAITMWRALDGASVAPAAVVATAADLASRHDTDLLIDGAESLDDAASLLASARALRVLADEADEVASVCAGDTPGVTIPAGPLARLREHAIILAQGAADDLAHADYTQSETTAFEHTIEQAIGDRRHLDTAGPYCRDVVARVAAEKVSWDAGGDLEWPRAAGDEAAVALTDHLAVIALRDECSTLVEAGAIA